MKCLDIKTGSILIYKKYGLLKCWWNKLMRKELPFNKYTLYFGNSSMFVETTNIKVKEKDRYIILEPIKPYSKKEEKALKLEDVESFTIDGLLKNKYYRVVYDSKGKNF